MSKNIYMIVLVLLLTLINSIYGALLFDENFNYPAGDKLTDHGWLCHYGGTDTVKVHSYGLSYTGYVSSGIGNAAWIDSTGADVNHIYTSQTSGTVYCAFLVNVQKATINGDYFTHLGPSPLGSAYLGRVHVKNDGSNNIAFGLGKGSSDTTFTTFSYALNTTYLFVLKYEIIEGSTNDIVSLFIFTTGAPTSEPPTPTIGPLSPSSTDPVNIGSVALRQGSATNGAKVILDGIRVGTSWSDVLPATGSTPTRLKIISINNGIAPSVNTPFSVVIQSQDDLGNVASVVNNTDVSISLAAGTGSLGGTLTGTIPASQNSVTITGITYNIAESGVRIAVSRTSGDMLAPDTTNPFTVYPSASQLAFVGVPVAAQPGIIMGSFTVEARRPDNSVDPNYTDSITISVASGPGTISGTVKKAAISGIATFNDIALSTSGSYTLNATATGLIPATSPIINVLTVTDTLIENFEYSVGTSLVYNGWSAHSGAGTNPLMVTTPGLTYPGYLSSGIGEATTVIGGSGTREDAHRIFTSKTDGNVYAAFMVNVTAAATTWDYFAHFGPQTIGTSFKGKVLVKRDASNNIAFGLTKTASAPPIDSTGYIYALNTTYLIVIRYTFVEGTDNDIVSLWINPSLSGPEPIPNLTASDGGDLSNVGSFALRQGSNSYSVIVDGIRVGTNWSIVNGIYPPIITNITRNPQIPLAGQSVTVTAKIYDAQTPLASLIDTLYYAVNTTTSWNAIVKTGYNASDSIFTYVIPAVNTEGDTVFYKIEAIDGDANKTTSSIYRYILPLSRTISQIQGSGTTTPDSGRYVVTTGIVTGKFGQRFFFEQRPGGVRNGLFTYRRAQDSFPSVAIGDSVQVIGIATEFQTLTQIDASYNIPATVNILATNRVLPCTTRLTIIGVTEDYEGCLIRIDSVFFKETGTFSGSTNYWVYNIANESLRLRIDAAASSIIGQAIPSETIAVIGNLGAYKDTFQLMPRVLSDFMSYVEFRDVGVIEVMAPAGQVAQGSLVAPKAKIKNFGNVIANDFKVIFNIAEAKQSDYSDTVTISSLGVGDELIVTFQPYHVSGNVGTQYNTEAKTVLIGDMNTANDIKYGGGFEVIEASVGVWSKLDDSMPAAYDLKPGKSVKDGGSMTVVPSGINTGIYAFHGNKSRVFRKYVPSEKGTWTELESIPFGYKLPMTEPPKINKKKIGKGAALCYDGNNIIYAVKGNGTREFWAYYLSSVDTIPADTWIALPYLENSSKPLKGGTSMLYYNGSVYILAGGQKVNDNNFFKFNVLENSWTTLTKTTFEPDNKPFKDGSCIVRYGDTIYALKGGGKNNYVYAYSITAGNWILFDSVPLKNSLGKNIKVKDGAAMAVAGDEIYVIKGGGKQDFYKYAIELGVWTELDTIPLGSGGKKRTPKTGASLVYYNNYLYLLKGNNSPEFWRYGPVSTKGFHNEVITNSISATTSAIQFSNVITNSNSSLSIMPNPSPSNAIINYNITNPSVVSIKLYNANGSLVKSLVNAYQSVGSYNLMLTNLATGIYFVRFEANGEKQEIKLIVQ
ncbi:MAG: T9SS type A sorting domain-containing protein [candidate division WOR-3 bacterium]